MCSIVTCWVIHYCHLNFNTMHTVEHEAKSCLPALASNAFGTKNGRWLACIMFRHILNQWTTAMPSLHCIIFGAAINVTNNPGSVPHSSMSEVLTSIMSPSSLLEHLLLDELSDKKISFLWSIRYWRSEDHRASALKRYVRNCKRVERGFKSCLHRSLCEWVPLRESLSRSFNQVKLLKGFLVKFPLI